MQGSGSLLVCGVALAVAVSGCSNIGGASAQNQSSGGTQPSQSKSQAGGTSSSLSEPVPEEADGGTSVSAGGTRASSLEQTQAGGARSSEQSSHAIPSMGGTRNTGEASGDRGGQDAGSVGGTSLRSTDGRGSSAGGLTATGGTTPQSRVSGGTSSGGTSSGGTSPKTASSTAAGGTSPFVLAWKDDFDSFDTSLWELMTHSWDTNLAQFSTDNVSTASGILSIQLTAATGDPAKPYRGVEMRSKRTLTYGKVSARIRFARGAGVVSALVTIYTPWPADNWNEIDIEHLGKSPTSTQLNCMVYTGAPVTPPATQSVSPTQDPLSVNLGFDAEADFHQYDIEWTPASIKFVVDGTTMRTWTKEIARMTLPQNILFTIWASSSADWAGAMTSASAPTSAEIDWIRVYEWRK